MDGEEEEKRGEGIRRDGGGLGKIINGRSGEKKRTGRRSIRRKCPGTSSQNALPK